MSQKFKEFKVYKDAKSLVVLIFRLTRRFPREFYYLSDQMNRCCLSIVLNIAEGAAKKSNKDFNRYIQNSLGSTSELAAALEIAKEFNLISEKELQETEVLLNQVIKQLGGFSKFLSKN
ncbi:MAG: four helix bundle protein [Candidatus Liptonbacteria bacterium]|nr:four helix bundle protein [Candidatus Liptonbacteria bacterium]